MGIRLAVAVQLGDHPVLQPQPSGVLDDAVYVALGTRIASGDLLLAPDAYFLPPLYAYFLGLLFKGGASIFAVRIIQSLLGAGTVWLIMATTRQLFGTIAGLIAGALATLTGLFAFNEILILQSSLDPFLSALALFALCRALKTPSTRWCFFAGAALAALVLNRPNAVACLVAVLAILLVFVRDRTDARRLAAIAAGACLLLAPVVLRNRIVGGEWVLITSHGGLNFYIGNGAGATGTWRPVPGVAPTILGQVRDVRAVAADAVGHQVTAQEASDYFYRRAWNDIAASPTTWLSLLRRKALLVLSAREATLNFSYDYYSRDERTVLSAMLIGPLILVPFGVLGLALGGLGQDRSSYIVWLAVPVTYLGTLVLFFVSSRYRLPLLVALVIGSGNGFVTLVRAWNRSKRQFSFAGCVLAALFTIALWPVRADDGRIQERSESVALRFRDGDIDEAERQLKELERAQPAADALLARIGTDLQRRGAWDQAIPYLTRAVSAMPNDGDLQFTLGQSLIHANRPEEASGHFESAAAIGLRSLVLYYDWALARQQVGDIRGAGRILGRVVPSRDDSPEVLFNVAKLAMSVGGPDIAEPFARAYVEHAPIDPDAHELLAIALSRMDRYNAAAIEAEAAVRLDSTNPTRYFNLAVVYAGAGRFADARRALDNCLRVDPGFSDAYSLRKKLPQN